MTNMYLEKFLGRIYTSLGFTRIDNSRHVGKNDSLTLASIDGKLES